MHKGIELEVFFADDQISTFEKVGMDYKLIDCPTRKITYYNISAISPYLDTVDSNASYCRIHCNDTDFICVHTYDQVKSIINLANKPKYKKNENNSSRNDLFRKENKEKQLYKRQN